MTENNDIETGDVDTGTGTDMKSQNVVKIHRNVWLKLFLAIFAMGLIAFFVSFIVMNIPMNSNNDATEQFLPKLLKCTEITDICLTLASDGYQPPVFFETTGNPSTKCIDTPKPLITDWVLEDASKSYSKCNTLPLYLLNRDSLKITSTDVFNLNNEENYVKFNLFLPKDRIIPINQKIDLSDKTLSMSIDYDKILDPTQQQVHDDEGIMGNKCSLLQKDNGISTLIVCIKMVNDIISTEIVEYTVTVVLIDLTINIDTIKIGILKNPFIWY
jgi:hypothetical protein